MIQPQELRIGNYVEYKGQMLPVLAIDNEAFLSELKYKGLVRLPDKLPNGMVFGSSGIWCAKINPIPITPEILDRIEGFALVLWNGRVKDYFIPITSGGLCSLSFRFGEWKDFPDRLDSVTIRPSPEGGGGSIYGKFDIKHLHQLQNLYFALTNQELTFKTTNNE